MGHLKTDIAEVERALERRRKKTVGLAVVIPAALVIAGIVFLALHFYLDNDYPFLDYNDYLAHYPLIEGLAWAAYSCLVIGILWFLFLNKIIIKKYAAMYKDLLVTGVLREMLTDVVFTPNKGLDEHIIGNTEMIKMGNQYSSDDLLMAKYKGVNFRQADVLIEKESYIGDDRYTETLFKGRWMIFDFNKQFSAELQVREKKFSHARKTGGWFGQRRRMEKMELEDAVFNKNFDVYAVNLHEAYYILTPHMMKNILELQAKIKGDIMLAFVDNKLHVAVHTGKNAFEPKLFPRVNAHKETMRIKEEVQVITHFIDEMDLDNTLFKQDMKGVTV